MPEPWRERTTPIAGERPQPGADRRAADADLRGQIALGRQPVAAPQLAALDQPADVRHDLFGAALARLAGPVPSESGVLILVCPIMPDRFRETPSDST